MAGVALAFGSDLGLAPLGGLGDSLLKLRLGLLVFLSEYVEVSLDDRAKRGDLAICVLVVGNREADRILPQLDGVAERRRARWL